MKKLTSLLILFACSLFAQPASTNRTLWLKADTNAKVYTDAALTTNAGNGDSIFVWDDEDVAADSQAFRDASGQEPTYTSSVAAMNSLGAVTFPGAKSMRIVNDAQSGDQQFSNFVTASAFTMYVVFVLTGDASNDGVIYKNMSPFQCDVAGVLLTTSGGVTTAYAYNFSAAPDTASATITQNAVHLARVRHASGTLYLSIDGGSESSVASGDTVALDRSCFIGTGKDYPLTGHVGEIVLYNADQSGTDRTNTTDYLLAKWGISGAPPPSSAAKRRIIP